jgi:hypothetical protein
VVRSGKILEKLERMLGTDMHITCGDLTLNRENAIE